MTVTVPKLPDRPEINANWDDPSFANTDRLLVANFMGEKPDHFPTTHFTVAYDTSALYVMFRVEDRYVRAAAEHHQGNVCKDSCVEFFFTPGPDVSKGYFNIEMNCGGTMLFHFQQKGAVGRVILDDKDLGRVEIAHTQPRIVEPELAEPVTWIVQYRVPFQVLESYCEIDRPAPGVIWLGNFYKCGDLTSHPHWLTWAPVNNPTPNFHLPEFFGTMEFTN